MHHDDTYVSAYRRDDIEKQFKDLDKANRGDLEIAELVSVLVKECAMDEPQARSLIDDFDVNKDGSIDKDEFMTMWLKLFG
mgnify:CR=1 FL=1